MNMYLVRNASHLYSVIIQIDSFSDYYDNYYDDKLHMQIYENYHDLYIVCFLGI